MINMPEGYNLGYAQLVTKNDNAFKNPMLIVGANTWMRTKIKHEILTIYDVHLFFCPTSKTHWQVACVMMHRVEGFKCISYNINSLNIQIAFENLVLLINNTQENKEAVNDKLNVWLIHSIDRCPKISLKDVLHLEPYKLEAA